ncbi:hypothetical protein ABZ137_03385 [Streptomyces bobili]|uniref:hypothetical protein n=1 Tax=Streptomyces bobili TaxID=67280 RepID=UPI0033B16D40
MKDTLASRVASRCSNPDCGAVTSGPKLQTSGAVNLGVGAHITAASPGGPRYDPALTSTERSAGDNGIWLCQNCAKLIDSDVVRYTVTTLRQWKAEAEHRALVMLQAGVGAADDSLALALPQLDSPDSLLAFASTAIARVGRDTELGELKTFLDAGPTFSWWLWTGSAGTGKSRLAIELCRAVSGEWHAGFLRENSQPALDSLQPTRPTLVVVDYAAQRSAWLSDALFRLSQQALSAPVRVLVLERQAAGPWWDMVQRTHRMEESFHIQASSYGLPRRLGGLSRPEIRRLVSAVGARAGADLSSTNIEDIADHAEEIDPACRPLFVLIATLDWMGGNGISADRDAALRRLIARTNSQRVQSPSSSPSARHVRNIWTLATALGGTSADSYAHLLHTLAPPTGLLPDVYSDFHPVSLDDLLDGVRPDILGELYVLDRLAAAGAEHLAAAALLRLAWQSDQEAYRAFVERAASDHREHPSLVDLLGAGDWLTSPTACVRMAVDTIPLLQRSDHPALTWIFSRLDSLRQSAADEAIDEITMTARFRLANLILNEGNARRANTLYTEALAACDPAWPVRSNILNNRGITWLDIGDHNAAIADFTAVINVPSATDEARACALNNRADIFDDDDDVASAVADRTSVLELAETTYNRRFIALIRRARTLWKYGEHDGAQRDIESILATGDIAPEQKMAARLQRAEWLIDSGAAPDAQTDLETVIASDRNFETVESRVRELLARPQTHNV